jgi:hypothetical protein
VFLTDVPADGEFESSLWVSSDLGATFNQVDLACHKTLDRRDHRCYNCCCQCHMLNAPSMCVRGGGGSYSFSL